MKKAIRYLVIFGVALFLVMMFAVNKIKVDIEDTDLPQDVYGEQGDLLSLAQTKLTSFFSPGTGEDEFTITEDFMNYIILHSIRENVNEVYDPLNDTCVETECDIITETSFGNVEYAFVELNDDNQLVVTVNFNREAFPSFETAIFATFDISLDILNLELVLELDSVMLNDINISVANLDRLLGLFDKDSIEEIMAIGILDLDDYTYTVPLIP